ncbi:unnamed protein product [Prorocentrum cordatum]|uniref:DUF5117 domain-containing protein n=1 Tax=Prorocentrum cordatum TaxID=2364126 RepID=A0ABN9UNH3_9DINO|nr:unnamed protein product [Polarella glacialis]
MENETAEHVLPGAAKSMRRPGRLASGGALACQALAAPREAPPWVSRRWSMARALLDEQRSRVPEFCRVAQKTGYVNVHGNETSENVLLDLSVAMGEAPSPADGAMADATMKFLVSVMAEKGTYSAETGQQIMPLSQPLEDSPHQMIELKLSPTTTEVDVYSPHLRIRTSDEDSSEALRQGMGSGRLGSLPRVVCGASATGGVAVRKMAAKDAASEKRVLIDLDSLLSRGFFAVADMDTWTLGQGQYRRVSTRIKELKAFPRNLNLVVEMMMAQAGNSRQVPVTVAFSIVKLPETPMVPRTGDNRLGYFASKYSDLGFHPQEISRSTPPSATVDSQRTMIWRYNLDRDEDKQIKIYVDPTVPTRWRKYVKEGIEAWNDGFAMFGANGTVKAIAPGDKDWPAEYDQGDARYTVVTWVLDTDRVVSRGHARVDPRSGEIMKSEISMSVGWLHAWLSDMDRLAPQLVQRSDSGYLQEEREPASAEGAAAAAQELAAPAPRAQRVADARAALFGSSQGADSSLVHLVAGSDSRLGLFHKGQPMSPRRQEEVLGEGIKQVVMHETGHILGLRHNFKGSLGVSYECTQDKACSGKHGLSSSVMDYLPINLPENDDPDSVHFFSPVIGEYDKLAIAYGYMPDSNDMTRLDDPDNVLRKKEGLTLQSLLNKAESFEVCLDSDSSQGEDPECRPYDFTSDPIRYFEATLRKHKSTHQHLLDTAVAPGKAYFHYGNAVTSLMGLTRDMGLKAARYIGGSNHSYQHRSDGGRHGPNGALRFQSAHTQRRALNLTKQVLQLSSSGLVPPRSSRKFLVSGQDDHLQVFNVDHAVRSIQKELMGELLSPKKLERLFDHSGDCEGEDCPLGVEELLSDLVRLFGVPRSADSPDWDLELQVVKSLKEAGAVALPAEVQSLVSQKLDYIGASVEALLEHGDSMHTWAPSGWQQCAWEGESCECHGQVRFGVNGSWSELRHAGGQTDCSTQAFEDPAPHKAKACQCLNEVVGKQERFHAHLLRLRRELESDKDKDK